MVPANPEPVSTPNKTPAQAQKHNPERPHWADRTIAVFTVLIFLTYITSNYFACETLQEIKRGGEDTHGLAVAAKSQADAAKAIADAAKAQSESTASQATSTKSLADRAFLQWQDLRHNFSVEQRAWLRAGFDIPPRLPDRPTASITGQTRNVGKSVAITPIVIGIVEIVKSADSPNFMLPELHSRSTLNPLFPGDDSEFLIADPTATSNFAPRSLTRDEIEGLRSGQLYIAGVGRIQYYDQFGTHWTRFCTWTAYNSAPGANSSFNARDCNLYGAVGDGEYKDTATSYK